MLVHRPGLCAPSACSQAAACKQSRMCDKKAKSRQWDARPNVGYQRMTPKQVAQQFRECMTGPTWDPVGLSGMRSVVFSKILQRMSRCPYPLYFSSASSAEIFEMQRTHYNRPLSLSSWEVIPVRGPSMVLDGRLHIFWEVVARNFVWARRRMLRSELLKGDLDSEPVTLDAGAILHAHSDGEGAPTLPPGVPALHAPSGWSSSQPKAFPGWSSSGVPGWSYSGEVPSALPSQKMCIFGPLDPQACGWNFG